jgi:hypothetical protein
MRVHTGYMEYSECLSTLLKPVAERTCFSQVGDLTAARAALAADVKVIPTPPLYISFAILYTK